MNIKLRVTNYEKNDYGQPVKIMTNDENRFKQSNQIVDDSLLSFQSDFLRNQMQKPKIVNPINYHQGVYRTLNGNNYEYPAIQQIPIQINQKSVRNKMEPENFYDYSNTPVYIVNNKKPNKPKKVISNDLVYEYYDENVGDNRVRYVYK